MYVRDGDIECMVKCCRSMFISSCFCNLKMSHLFLIKHTYAIQVIHQIKITNIYHNVDAFKE